MARRSNRQRRKRTKRRLDAPQLLTEARLRLRKGEAREAIDGLKQARHADASQEGLDVTLCCAYALRARQLAHRGMADEAAAMRKQASVLRECIDRLGADEEEALQCVRCLEATEAVQVYARYAEQASPSDAMDRILADRTVVEDCWEALEGLDEDHPLRRDAQVVSQATDGMARGAWQEAGAALAGIGRRSPFAPWRFFCKAMVGYEAGDNLSALRALNAITEGFPLSRTVSEMRRACDPESHDTAEAAASAAKQASAKKRQDAAREERVASVLGLHSSTGEGLARQLLAAVQTGRLREVERLISTLAEAIYPEDSTEARVTLMEIVAMGVSRIDGNVRAVLKAIGRLLPRPKAKAVAARMEMLSQCADYGEWSVIPASTYLNNLEAEFPDEDSRRMARAQLAEFVARQGDQAVPIPDWLHPTELALLGSLAGASIGSAKSAFPDLLRASLREDPDNRKGHLFLLAMLRRRSAPGREIEEALVNMKAHFHDDPWPCLELAGHYYSMNAYRKAETALAEARQRAPHDERILDREAIGCLKSADENRKRGKWHLVETDLRRAEALGRRRVGPILLVKRLAFDLISRGGAKGGVGLQLDLYAETNTESPAFSGPDPYLQPLSAAMQVRTLAVLISDLAGIEAESVHLAKEWLRDRRGLMDGQSAEEILDLLAPVEEDFALLFADVHVAPALSEYWPDLMACLEGDGLLSAVEILLGCDGHDAARTEIDRRLSGQKREERDPLLLFYLEVIRQIEGRSDGSQHFEAIVDAAGEAQEQRLRASASRLARYAEGPLRTALQEFDFGILELPYLPIGSVLDPFADEGVVPHVVGDDLPGGPPFPGTFLEEDDDDDWGDSDLVVAMEDLLDRAGVRGAPISQVRDFSGTARSDPEMRRILDAIADEYRSTPDELTRELQILVFPKRKGKKRERK